MFDRDAHGLKPRSVREVATGAERAVRLNREASTLRPRNQLSPVLERAELHLRPSARARTRLTAVRDFVAVTNQKPPVQPSIPTSPSVTGWSQYLTQD